VKIAGVVLAAGASTRLGRPKQTVIIDGEALVERAARVAHEAGLSPVIVVVNSQAEFAEQLLAQGCMIVVNEHAAKGMASSIHCGVSAADGCDGVVVMACDQPALTSAHLMALCAESGTASGSAYGGKIGIPAYFPASNFGSLLQLKGDTGARDLLRNARAVPFEDLSFDIDTEEDIAQLRAKTKCDPH